MKPAPQASNEVGRMEALREYGILDSLPEQALDDLTALAAHICEAPIALISLIDERRQWFKSRFGCPVGETPRDISFCGHAILETGLFIVPDAAQDERFADNPLVTGDPHIRFYAGAPLVTAEGQALGALCIIDHVPRQLNPSQQEALRVLSRQVMTQLELRRQTRDLLEREQHIQHLNRVHAVLSGINEIIVREKDTQAMLEAACRIAVEKGCFRLAWIGLVEESTGGLRIAAHAGAKDDTLQILKSMAGSAQADCAFTFHALRTGQHGICNDIAHDPQTETWRDAALQRGYCAMAALPLKANGEMAGTFNLYAGEPGFFDADELRLLDDLAADIGFALQVHNREAERIGFERALRESEASLAAAQARAHLGSWELDLTAMKGSWSTEMSRLYGRDPSLGAPAFEEFLELVHPEDRTNILNAQACIPEAEGPIQVENRTNPSSGPVRLLSTTMYVLRDASGRAVRVAGTTLDVTERKQAEQRIQRLNRIYAVLSDINQTIVREKEPQAMLDAVCRLAVEKGEFRMAWIGMFNTATRELRPVASNGVVEGYTDLVKINLGDDSRCTGPSARCLLSGEHAICNDIEHDPLHPPWRDEALRRGYKSSAAFPIKVGGKVVGVFILYARAVDYFDVEEMKLLDELAMDVSFALEVSQREQEQRKTEEELRWRTAFFEAQVDSAIDGLLVVDNRGMKVVQNQRLTDLWKIPAHIADDRDASAQLEFAAKRTKNPGEFLEKIAHLNATPDEISRDIIELVDGTVLDRTSSPVRDKAGKLYGRIWSFRDITQQRQLELQLRQSQKMEAIGQLAGGVAHDFNNILGAMMLQLDIAGTEQNQPPKVRAMLDDLQSYVERAANLTRQLLAFSRRQVMQLRVLDLNEVVSGLTKMLKRIVGEDVRLQLNLNSHALWTNADAGMLDQVLLNLVVNARDAMPEGGQLAIGTKENDFTPGEAALIPDAQPGRYVSLSITDSGCGIAPENLPRIFEPFFTTKEAGKGTGLGLATVFGIVKQHGGCLKVESEVGRGTTFWIFLRAAEATDAAVTREISKPKPCGGTETILLVEDDQSVRVLTRTILEQHGYQVLEATHAVDALRIWDLHAGPIHLLLTDIVMPEGVSGQELAAWLQERNPQLRVIFTSGYSGDIAGRDFVLQEGQNFLQKPCPTDRILETVRKCLDT